MSTMPLSRMIRETSFGMSRAKSGLEGLEKFG
jgi:hypothetical protein